MGHGGCAREAMSVRVNPMACKETSETQGGECTLCAKRAWASATHLLRGAPGFFCTADLEGDHGAAARPFPPISAGYWPAFSASLPAFLE